MIFIIAGCGALAVFLIVVSAWVPLQQQFKSRYSAAQNSADLALRAAAIYTMTPQRLVQLRGAAALSALVLALAMSGNAVLAILAAVLASFLPKWWVEHKRLKRLQRLEEVLPGALDQLTNSVRAGLSLAQALEEVSGSGPAPANEEFAIIVREHRLGAALIDCIESARMRIGGRFFPLFATSLRMNIERGGNLPEALQRMAESFREIWRLEQKMITASAEARKSMRVIGAMPAFVALLVFLTQPDIIDTLTGSLLGWMVLAVFAAMYAGGLLWLRRLMQMEA
jgi:tight adherence protein B